ncbi:unnamed protein product, partial [Didymodactylos carnosus]
YTHEKASSTTPKEEEETLDTSATEATADPLDNLDLPAIGDLFVLCQKKIKYRQTYFERLNIPCPPPTFFFGNYRTLWTSGIAYSKQLQQWTREYGHICSMYEGTQAIYVVSDVELLQEIFIKQFSNFNTHHKTQLLIKTRKNQHDDLIASSGQQWKRQRTILNPVFSQAKLKQMAPLVDNCIAELMTKLSSSENNVFNIYPYYKRLATDVILKCAFDVTELNVQNIIDNKENIYLIKIQEFLSTDTATLLIYKIAHLTELAPVLGWTLRFVEFLASIVKSQVAVLPLDWFTDHIQEFITVNDQLNDVKKLTYDELLINTLLFLTAGYETTSASFAYATYILATHSDVQKKLQDEIDTDTHYIDLFWKEVSRMYPIATPFIKRHCVQNTQVLDYKIKKGIIYPTELVNKLYFI